jgi:hypothetical protein
LDPSDLLDNRVLEVSQVYLVFRDRTDRPEIRACPEKSVPRETKALKVTQVQSVSLVLEA